MNKVDIIMGIFNCENYLEECFDSLLNQSFKSWKLIMCDDGSTDSTYEIAKKIKQKYPKKVVLLKNDKNCGLNYTLNKCLSHSTAAYIARQDADDLSLPNRLEQEFNFLEKHKQYSICSSSMIMFDENGKWGEAHYPQKPTRYDFIHGTPFAHAASMMRRKDLLKVNGYSEDEKLTRVEDYHLWFKMYKDGMVGYNIAEPLYLWRDDRNALKRRTWKARKNEYYVKKIGFRMLKLPRKFMVYAYLPLFKYFIPSKITTAIRRKRGRNAKN